MELARPSTNPFAAGDPNPAATRRALLTLIAEQTEPKTPRELNELLYGSDLAGRTRTGAAVGWLRNAGLIERAGPYGGSKRVRITEAGRIVLAFADEVMADIDAAIAEANLPPCTQEGPS